MIDASISIPLIIINSETSLTNDASFLNLQFDFEKKIILLIPLFLPQRTARTRNFSAIITSNGDTNMTFRQEPVSPELKLKISYINFSHMYTKHNSATELIASNN